MHVHSSLDMDFLQEIAALLQSRMSDLLVVSDSYSWVTTVISWFFVCGLKLSPSLPLFSSILLTINDDTDNAGFVHGWTDSYPHCLRLLPLDLPPRLSHPSEEPRSSAEARVVEPSGIDKVMTGHEGSVMAVEIIHDCCFLVYLGLYTIVQWVTKQYITEQGKRDRGTSEELPRSTQTNRLQIGLAPFSSFFFFWEFQETFQLHMPLQCKIIFISGPGP